MFYYRFLPTNIKRNILYIIVFSLFVLGIQINEIINCQSMLEKYPNFPFHVIVEISVFIPIMLLCYSFYKI